MVLSPFEFDEDDDDLSALAWAHPNKSFRFDFSEGVVKGDGWEFPDEIDKSVFIRPASKLAWEKLKPTLEN